MSFANEWASKGVNVNAIAPGYIATDNTKALREDPVRNKAILDRIPQGRWGTPGRFNGYNCVPLFRCFKLSKWKCSNSRWRLDGTVSVMM